MYIIIGLGTISLFMYMLNCKKETMFFNILKFYSNIENKLGDIYNLIYNNDNKYILEEICDLNHKETQFYILNFKFKNKNLYQIINFEENNDQTNKFYNILNNYKERNNYINYKSSILSCFLTFRYKDISFEKEIDLTEIINKFINYNCKLTIDNNKVWLYFINKYELISKDEIKEIYDNIEHMVFNWKLILDTIEIYENEKLLIEVNNGILKII